MFRFTIRDLLWLMALVGMACGWWLEHRQRKWFELKADVALSEYRKQKEVTDELWKITGRDHIVMPEWK
jgi:hypothetical protein